MNIYKESLYASTCNSDLSIPVARDKRTLSILLMFITPADPPEMLNYLSLAASLLNRYVLH